MSLVSLLPACVQAATALCGSREDPADEAVLLRDHPNLATLGDDDIEVIAMSHISRVDYAESDMHRVRATLLRLRDRARDARTA